MKKLLTIILFLPLLSCNVEPEPLHYGTDGCSHCKMTLMDKKFGAELVTQKGRIYKFDDINCMLTFYNANELNQEDFLHKLVVDFSQPGQLISASDAFYLKSSEIKSPMASQVAAFEKKENMEDVKDRSGGIYLVWGELVTQFK